MTDGRLRVVLAGSPYPQPEGPRPFLEASGYEVLSEPAGRDDLLRAVREGDPDLVVLGPGLIDHELVRAVRDIAPSVGLVAVARGRPTKALLPFLDGHVPYGAPLGSLAAELGRVAVQPRGPSGAVEAPDADRPPPAVARIAPIAAAVAIVTGAWILFATVPEGQLLPRPDEGSPSPSPGITVSPSPGTVGPTPEVSPLDDALTALEGLVDAIVAEDFARAAKEAERLVRERERAIEAGFDVRPLDVTVAARLGPMAQDLPAPVAQTLRGILGDLLPPVGSSVAATGDGTFGEVPVGTVSGPRPILVSNVGAEGDVALEVEVSGTSADRFTVSDGCGGRSLAPEETCTIEVAFRPASAGPADAQLLVVPEEGQAVAVPLSGTGVVVAPPDTDPPVLLCDPVGSGWHGSDVVVPCTATDAGSGLADPGQASFVLRTSTSPGTETTDARTDARTVCDREGNCLTVGPIGGIRIDKAAPDVRCDRPDGGWHAENVSVGCAARDGGSGVGSDARLELSTHVARGVETDDARTGTRRVCDRVGNCTTAGPVAGIKVDRKAPEVTCRDANGGWHAENVRVGCRATDGGSGVRGGETSFDLVTDVPLGSETADARTGTREVCDGVGNCVTAGPVGGIKVDRKAPTVAVAAPSAGAVFLLDQGVSASFACDDGGSGAVSCQGSGAVDTAAVGNRTFSVTARDAVGNEVTVSVDYVVTYGVQLVSDPGETDRKVQIRLVNASGVNVSSSQTAVTALDLDGVPMNRRLAYIPGQQAYRLNLPGHIEDGQHALRFTAEGDPVVHSVTFTVD